MEKAQIKKRKCSFCKKIVFKHLNDILRYKHSFCNKTCRASWMKKEKLKLFNFGNKHHNWKGDKVKYEGLHIWIKNNFKKPKLCQKCKKIKPYDLANISPKFNKKTYTRDIKNWEWLCRKCHMIKDGRMKKVRKACLKYVKNKRISVIQFDLKGNKIAIFESINEAAKKNKFYSGNIYRCLVGKNKKYNNFIWDYATHKTNN